MDTFANLLLPLRVVFPPTARPPALIPWKSRNPLSGPGSFPSRTLNDNIHQGSHSTVQCCGGWWWHRLKRRKRKRLAGVFDVELRFLCSSLRVFSAVMLSLKHASARVTWSEGNNYMCYGTSWLFFFCYLEYYFRFLFIYLFLFFSFVLVTVYFVFYILSTARFLYNSPDHGKSNNYTKTGCWFISASFLRRAIQNQYCA